MTYAREIIAMCQHDHGLTFPSEFEVADHVIDRLTSAGFHILGPDDWRDVKTVVEIANRNEDSPEGFRLARALKEKRT